MCFLPKMDRVTTDLASIRLLGKRGAIPDDFSRGRIDRESALAWCAGGTRGYLRFILLVFAFANDRFQGDGLPKAEALPATVVRVTFDT